MYESLEARSMSVSSFLIQIMRTNQAKNENVNTLLYTRGQIRKGLGVSEPEGVTPEAVPPLMSAVAVM